MPDEQITSEFEPQALKSPRVSLIASSRIVAEYTRYLKYLLIGLADESVPVQLICPPKLEIDAIVPPAVEVVRHPVVDVPLMEHYNRKILIDRISAFGPDVLHCLCETKASLTRWLARHLDIPYVLNIAAISRPWHAVTISQTRCAAIIAPAKTIAAHFTSVHPKFADRVHQINIGAFVEGDTACFAHSGRVPGIVIANPPAGPGELDNLFRAFHRLSVDNYQFMVALIGAGRAEKHLRKLLSELGLLRVVTIVPQLNGFDSALSAADIFIVPRPSTSFNMALLAAMAAGCAVAASPGGVDDLIIDGQTALTFNPDDQLSIYNALKRLLDARDFARQLAFEAQQFLRQNHHVSDMITSTLQLYRKAACYEK